MELATADGFNEMSKDETLNVDGGGPWETALAVVGGMGFVLLKSFEAGRQFVKDIRNKIGD